MSKPVTSLATTAALSLALSLGTVACKSEVTKESQDVEEAQEELQEEQRELQEEQRELQEEREEQQEEIDEAKAELAQEQAELDAAMAAQVGEAEARYIELVAKITDASEGDAKPGPVVEAARSQAETKLKAAKIADTPELIRKSLQELEDALDKLEREIAHLGDQA